MTNKVKLPDALINGTLYEVVEVPECNECAFSGGIYCHNIACSSFERDDGKSVIFKVKL